jgi:predicted kinase
VAGLEVGSPAWLERVFAAEARADIFGARRPAVGVPLLVLLGGQPAAGKTTAQRAVLAANPDAGLVPVTGDDLREHHPDYPELAADGPLEMPGATAGVSGGLVKLALDHALAGRYSVLLEGTFRDTGMVEATARRFAQAGYRVEVVAVAAPAAASRLSAEQRCLADQEGQLGRWTPPGAHEAALAASSQTVAALEALPFVSRVQVHTRGRVLYDNQRGPAGEWLDEPRAARVVRAEQDRRLAPAEAADWLDRYQEVFQRALARPGYLSAATMPAYRRLQQDAAAMIPIAAAHPGAHPAALLRAHDWRRNALNAAGASGRRSRPAQAPRLGPSSPSWDAAPPRRESPGMTLSHGASQDRAQRSEPTPTRRRDACATQPTRGAGAELTLPGADPAT